MNESDPSFPSPTHSTEIDPRTLPVFQHRDPIVKLIRGNRVVVISGATGSGKSTLIPQFILEDARMQQEDCRILCTQPRRLAATSLAKRVANDLRTTVGGHLVGYAIGGDYQKMGSTSIVFCTTGYASELIMHNRAVLSHYTHIIIDEVHERQVQIDLLMNLVREAMPSHPRLRLVLMSATIASSLFQKYFAVVNSQNTPLGASLQPQTSGKNVVVVPCPGYNVPTSLFHVEEYFLEDCMDFVQQLPSGITGKLEASFDSPRVSDHMLRFGMEFLWTMHLSAIDSRSHSYLVFLPGLNTIQWMQESLEVRDVAVHGEQNPSIQIHVLHSTVPPEDQDIIFVPAPPNVRKIILSTNIAESSLTIPDVIAVVDFCLTKVMMWNEKYQSLSLEEIWISKDIAHQRRGRAGRVQNGRCYRMIPEWLYDDMRESVVPEICQVPLDATVLSILRMHWDTPEEVLQRCIEPPDLSELGHVYSRLQNIGALTETPAAMDESHRRRVEVTKLGDILSGLNVDLSLGMMIIYGQALGLLREAILLVAIISNENPILHPRDLHVTSGRYRFQYAKGSDSDIIAALHAYNIWYQHYREHKHMPAYKLRDWARSKWISSRWMFNVHNSAKQIASRLPFDLDWNIRIAEIHDLDQEDHYTEVEILLLKLIIAAAQFDNLICVSSRFAPPKSQPKAPRKLASTIDHTRSVYIEGLDGNVNEDMLVQYLESFQGGVGTVSHTILHDFAFTKNAVVEFEDTQSAKLAFKLARVWDKKKRMQKARAKYSNYAQEISNRSRNSGAATSKSEEDWENFLGESISDFSSVRLGMKSLSLDKDIEVGGNDDSILFPMLFYEKPPHDLFFVASTFYMLRANKVLARENTMLPKIAGIEKLILLLFRRLAQTTSRDGSSNCALTVRGTRISFSANLSDKWMSAQIQTFHEHINDVVANWKIEKTRQYIYGKRDKSADHKSKDKAERSVLETKTSQSTDEVSNSQRQARSVIMEMIQKSDQVFNRAPISTMSEYRISIPDQSVAYIRQNIKEHHIRCQLTFHNDGLVTILYSNITLLKHTISIMRELVNEFISSHNLPKEVFHVLILPNTKHTGTVQAREHHQEKEQDQRQFFKICMGTVDAHMVVDMRFVAPEASKFSSAKIDTTKFEISKHLETCLKRLNTIIGNEVKSLKPRGRSLVQLELECTVGHQLYYTGVRGIGNRFTLYDCQHFSVKQFESFTERDLKGFFSRSCDLHVEDMLIASDLFGRQRSQYHNKMQTLTIQVMMLDEEQPYQLTFKHDSAAHDQSPSFGPWSLDTITTHAKHPISMNLLNLDSHYDLCFEFHRREVTSWENIPYDVWMFIEQLVWDSRSENIIVPESDILRVIYVRHQTYADFHAKSKRKNIVTVMRIRELQFSAKNKESTTTNETLTVKLKDMELHEMLNKHAILAEMKQVMNAKHKKVLMTQIAQRLRVFVRRCQKIARAEHLLVGMAPTGNTRGEEVDQVEAIMHTLSIGDNTAKEVSNDDDDDDGCVAKKYASFMMPSNVPLWKEPFKFESAFKSAEPQSSPQSPAFVLSSHFSFNTSSLFPSSSDTADPDTGPRNVFSADK